MSRQLQTPGTTYAVDIVRGTCDCPGYAHHGVCKHLAATLAELGELPDPDMPSTSPVQPVIAEPVAIICASCFGDGVETVRDHRGDWWDRTCHVCRGRGRVSVQASELPSGEWERTPAGQVLGAPCDRCFGAGSERVFLGGPLSNFETPPCPVCMGAGLKPIPSSTAIAAA